MSSTTLQKLSSASAGEAIVGAVETVAERSFFAVVDRCDEQMLRALSRSIPRWLMATVHFDDGPVKGAMVCTLPEDLAYVLFDGFSGRDPKDPAPADRHLHDLVGEFANMVCGAWLSRSAGDRAFRLGTPFVARISEPAAGAPGRSWLGIGNRPAAIDVWLHPEIDAAVAVAGA